MSRKHIKLCENALVESQKSQIAFQHGSLITKGSKIITKGYNHNRSTYKGKHCLCMHSEMVVISNWIKICCKDIKNDNDLKRKGSKYTIYIIRNNKDFTDNNFSMSKPCIMCTKMIKKCNFKKIIYTTGDEEIIKIVKPKQLDENNAVTSCADRLQLGVIENGKHISELILN